MSSSVTLSSLAAPPFFWRIHYPPNLHYGLSLPYVSCAEYRYRGYHDNNYPYGYSRTYWHLLTARLAFVFVFQFIVYAITGFIAWLVPDRPDELQFKAEREKQVIKTVFHDSGDDSDLEEYSDNDDDTEEFEDAKQEIDIEE